MVQKSPQTNTMCDHNEFSKHPINFILNYCIVWCHAFMLQCMNLNDIMIFLKKFKKNWISFSISFQIILFYHCNVLIHITQCLFMSQCASHDVTLFFLNYFFKKNSIFFSCCDTPIQIMTYDNFVFKFAFKKMFFFEFLFFQYFFRSSHGNMHFT